MVGFTDATFQVLAELKANNNKEWYDSNRDRLITHARDPFAGMLRIATALLEGSRSPLQGSDKTMFRQNRDVRFSKDKTLYKSTVSGMLTPSGSKDEKGGVVYAQIGPETGFLGAGYFQLSTAQLNLIRDQIIATPDRWAEVVERLRTKDLALSYENTLKTMPRGFAQHDGHEHVSALRLKSFVIRTDQPRAVWLNGDIVERMVAMAEATAPLNAFIREGLTRSA